LKNQKLNIVRPLFPDISEFIKEFEISLKSGQVTNNSPWVQKFEKDLAEYVGVKHCAAMVNGEAALMLMIRAAGLKGSILLPSYTFSGTVHSAVWNGLEPVFVDIDKETLNINTADLLTKIKRDTSAILAVPMYGNPCRIEELERISLEHGLKLLFDSAPAFGSEYKGRKLGNFGLAESFSFHATKVFSTMEGGAVFTDSDEIFTKVCELRNFGQFAECDCSDFGLNAKMTEICALIGIKNLPKLESWVEHRNKLTAYFSEKIKDVKGIKLQKITPGAVSNRLYLFISVNPVEYGINRNELLDKFVQNNIFARRFFCNPVQKMKCYEKYSKTVLPDTEYIAENGLSLPLYSDMSYEEIDLLVNVIKTEYNPKAK
jgi:dTDP-4-amino-4,6-dideoxyglucose